MSRKIITLLTVLVMLFALTAVSLAEPKTGTGTAQGYEGPVTVTITVDGKDITKVDIVGENETEGIGGAAIEEFDDIMVENDLINVDTMAGATATSNAIREAAKLALENAGLNPEDFIKEKEEKEEKKESAESETLETDIVVVGAGGAGMVSAITAADLGKKVVVVESQAMVGGNSIRATGGMNAGDTPFQDKNEFKEEAGVEKTLKAAAEKYADNATITELAKVVSEQYEAYKKEPKGYFDTVELMQLDALIGGKGINNPELIKTLCVNSSKGVEWLHGVDIDLTDVGAFGGASVKRIHRPVDENGKTLPVGSYMIPKLEKAMASRENIKLLLNTTAEKITLNEDGSVGGIIAKDKSGKEITIKAKAVVLASGGFGANLDMVSELKPALKGFMTTNAPGIKGKGIEMAKEVGAALVDMDQIQIHPTVQADTAALITEGLRGDGAILVNQEGKRFVDEVGTRDVVSAAEIAQPGSYSYLIVDQKMADASKVIQGYIKKGFTKQGESLEALAKELGINEADFANTVNDWNKKVAEKKDDDFKRTSFANPLDTAPFYAIKVTAGVHHTMGGVKIDTDTHVLNEKDEIINGLFACGEITGGVHGANRLGGNAVADFVVFGRIAGEKAAESIK